MVNQTHPQQVQQQLLGTATQLLQKRPFILWGAALVLVLLMGGLALKGLIYPGPLETTEAELPTTQPQPQASGVTEVDSNLWMFGVHEGTLLRTPVWHQTAGVKLAFVMPMPELMMSALVASSTIQSYPPRKVLSTVGVVPGSLIGRLREPFSSV